MYPTVASISNNAFLNHYNLPTSVNLGTDYENLQELIRKDVNILLLFIILLCFFF